MNSPPRTSKKKSKRFFHNGVALLLAFVAIVSGHIVASAYGRETAPIALMLCGSILAIAWWVAHRAKLLPLRPYPIHIGLFAATYFFVAGLGNGLALIPGVSIIFWPPAGVFLAVLLLNPVTQWPIYILGGCLAELACNEIWFHNPLPFALLIFGANTLEALAAAWLLRRYLGRPFKIETPAAAGVFILLGAIVAPTVGATMIATIDAWRGKHPFLVAWSHVWLGDGSGLLVSTPLALTAIRAWRGRARIDSRRVLEATLIGGALIGVGTLAFWNWLPTALLTLPLVLWAATRFQIPGAAVAVSIVTLMTAYYTITGSGEFTGTPQEKQERIVMLQVFLGITSISALLTSTLSFQRQQAFQSLEKLNRDLERKVAERTNDLRNTEERMNLALAAARAGTWEYNLTTHTAHWCPEMYAIYGLPPNRTPPTWEEFASLIDAQDRDRAMCERASAAMQDGPFTIEFRILNSDNEACWILSTGVIEGKVARGIDQDISARKYFEESLKRSDERLRLSSERLSMAASAAGFGLLHVDIENGVIHFSSELKSILGYPADHDFGLMPGDVPPFIHPDDVDALQRHWERIQLKGNGDDSVVHEHRIVRPDGEMRWVRLQTKTIFEEEGDNRRPVQVMGTLLDITKQRDYEQSLTDARRAAEQANAAKSLFVANISHEIRTPMTSVLGYAELLNAHVQSAQAKEYLKTISRNGSFLLEIINDLLDLSKIESGKFEISIERFSLKRLIDEVCMSMEVRAKEKNLKLSVEYETPIPALIESDSKRIKQILINLIGNAIKFTPSGEVKLSIHFLSQHPQSTLKLTVRDTGIGMTEEQVGNLFQPFTQGDISITRRFGGTGLGLEISQRLAKMLGGYIDVKSEFDKGSIFTVCIATGSSKESEWITPQTQSIVAEVAMEALPLRLHNWRILCVDDRRDIRYLVTALLTKEGAITSEAEDGSIALAKVVEDLRSNTAPDAILLDMQMPILDGFETAKQLRERGYLGPIIALTADAMESEKTRSIECGCDDYLSKPINSKQLIEKVLFTASLRETST